MEPTSELPFVTDGDAAVLRLLRDGVPRTRSQLIAATGMARSTIGVRLDRLTARGLVAAVGTGTSSGGRPPDRFAFRPRARLVAAVEIGATHARIGLVDLAGDIVASAARELVIADGPERVLAVVVADVKRLLATVGRDTAALVGVGVGLPGPVEHATGRPVAPPIMPGWDGFDVPASFRAALGAAVLVDNDVNLLALGEHSTAWPRVSDLVYVKVSTGVGMGMVATGRLQRGAQGTAGDLGHFRVLAPEPTDLESVASGPAIAARMSARGVPAASAHDVVGRVLAGDAVAVEEVERAGAVLGAALANCVTVLNPSVLVIGGTLAEAGEHLLGGIRDGIAANAPLVATASLTITRPRVRIDAGVIGAATLVLRAAFGEDGRVLEPF